MALLLTDGVVVKSGWPVKRPAAMPEPALTDW